MLSYLSVSNTPKSRLRHWCCSTYLRISPLHLEFHSSLLYSSSSASNDRSQTACETSDHTDIPALVRLTPNASGQRSPPTYYRGCWHVVSRGFGVKDRQGVSSYAHTCSSLTTEFYDPKIIIIHAA